MGRFQWQLPIEYRRQILRSIRSHPHANSDSYAYSNPNAVHGQMHTNAKAASHSSAAALAHSLTIVLSKA